MLMKPNKAETAVHGCHCRGNMAVRVRKGPARPWVDVRVCHLLLLLFYINLLTHRSAIKADPPASAVKDSVHRAFSPICFPTTMPDRGLVFECVTCFCGCFPSDQTKTLNKFFFTSFKVHVLTNRAKYVPQECENCKVIVWQMVSYKIECWHVSDKKTVFLISLNFVLSLQSAFCTDQLGKVLL